MKIITNNAPRLLKYGYEMPEKLRGEFNYIPNDEFDIHNFFTYKGTWYDANEFMRVTSEELKGWDGYFPDSYFSGTLVKFSKDGEYVIIGRYMA